MSDIATPCVKICVIQPETQICIGCGRSRDEIAAWLAFSAAQRAAIMADLPQRLKSLTARGNGRERPSQRRRAPQ